MFQSTFPQGERRELRADKADIAGFNPRSRKGNDESEFDGLFVVSQVSIHVPARGTTFLCDFKLLMFHVSIHVPARGTTWYLFYASICIAVSIHVPARGTTRPAELY